MNIFYLDVDPATSARYHMDKHVRKMIIEYAQLLSTAHRVIDGEMYYDKTAAGRRIARWSLSDWREDVLYKATHVNHPSAKWVRESKANYDWLYNMFCNLCNEFSYRWKKSHATWEKVGKPLHQSPDNIPNIGLTKIPQAMEDIYKMDDPLDGYKQYYVYGKAHLAEWTKRGRPSWYAEQ